MHDILTQMLSKLNANVNLKAYVTRIVPFSTTDINTMIYNFVPLTSDGIKGQARLELTAICDNYKNALNAIVESKITLLTIADNQFSNDILKIDLNGGGSLKNEEIKTYHEKANFTITYKERMQTWKE